jgi:hypothetical protein
MEKLLKDSVSSLAKEQDAEFHDVDTMLATNCLALDQESMIENGILQDYLDVFGSMEDNY